MGPAAAAAALPEKRLQAKGNNNGRKTGAGGDRQYFEEDKRTGTSQMEKIGVWGAVGFCRPSERVGSTVCDRGYRTHALCVGERGRTRRTREKERETRIKSKNWQKVAPGEDASS